MTIRSAYWDGHTVGHATEAPYSSQKFMSTFLQTLFVYDRREQGVVDTGFPEYPGGFQVVGAAGSVNVQSGVAIVDGEIVLNDANINILIPTPAVATRIDRIVLRKRYAPNGTNPQTVEAARIAGVEGGGAPAITQDVTGTTFWDIKLAQVSITTLGVITVTSEAQAVRTPLGPGYQEKLLGGDDLTHTAGVWNDLVGAGTCQVVLGPGKWVLWGAAFIEAGSTFGTRALRLYDATTAAMLSAGAVDLQAPAAGAIIHATVSLVPVVVIFGVITTVKLQFFAVDANDVVYGGTASVAGNDSRCTGIYAQRVI